jgi:transcriptional regulator with PAS, ATPase and Fis domain
MPPLRMRKEDVEPLTLHFIELFNKKYSLSKEILAEGIAVLKGYEWPGNVRELSNVIERSMIGYDGKLITKFQIERQLTTRDVYAEKEREQVYLREALEKYERDIFLDMLSKYSSQSEIARVLGIDKATVSRKLRKHNLSSEII